MASGRIPIPFLAENNGKMSDFRFLVILTENGIEIFRDVILLMEWGLFSPKIVWFSTEIEHFDPKYKNSIFVVIKWPFYGKVFFANTNFVEISAFEKKAFYHYGRHWNYWVKIQIGNLIFQESVDFGKNALF